MSAAGLAGCSPHSNHEPGIAQMAQAEPQLHRGPPRTDPTVTALALNIATELCTATLKEAEELRARVHELEHELQRMATKQGGGPVDTTLKPEAIIVPSRIEDRGSPWWPHKNRTVPDGEKGLCMVCRSSGGAGGGDHPKYCQ